MTTATTPTETLTVSRDVLVDAIAAILAASNLAADRNKRLHPEYRADAISHAANRLREAVFGSTDFSETDPLELAANVRVHECVYVLALWRTRKNA